MGSDGEIVNKDLVICHLTTDRTIEIEVEARRGRGYVTSEENAREEQEIGVIPVDSVFSPVLRVRYRTENTRVGKMTNYDRLILEIWTDGTITPEAALVEASKVYRKHLNPFIQLFDTGKDLAAEAPAGETGVRAAPAPAPVAAAAPSGDVSEVRRTLELPISHMDLSVRASNSLEAEGIQTIGDLVSRTEDELMMIKNFGRTSYKEIQKQLEKLNLRLGMDVAAILGPSA